MQNQPSDSSASPSASYGRSRRWQLIAVFAAIYFIQGIAEPTEGLIAQPVRSLLEDRGLSAGSIALFAALLSIPWWIKPLYGLLTDFVPLFGYRRKSYLALASLLSSGSLIAIYYFPQHTSNSLLLWLFLLLPTVAIALSDVVADAAMVEKGQQFNMTGQLQSVQWTAIYAASIMAGFLGGELSSHGRQYEGLLLCGLTSLLMFFIALLGLREVRYESWPNDQPALAALHGSFGSPVVRLVGLFLFLWTFNPFSNSVLDFHMTQSLGYSEAFFGRTNSCIAAACVAASLFYFVVVRRLPFPLLLRASVPLGVISTLAYWGLDDQPSTAMLISAIVGFTYMLGQLIQLDLAARLCPPHLAGTIFAMLMSISNLSLSIATLLGGAAYTYTSANWGAATSFNVLVAVGGAFTLASWLVIPSLERIQRTTECDSKGL